VFGLLALALLAQLPDAGPSPSDAGEADAGVTWQRPPPVARPLARQVDEARVERVFASLTLRERAAQLVLAYPQISKGPVEVGGVLFVGNLLRNVPKAAEKIASLGSRARIPPFFAVDMEGGPSNRMKSLKALRELPAARELADLDDKEVQRWGRKVGQAMQAIGLNLNLAPVLDVAQTGHMADNRRSFSGDPAVVVQKASAYARGLLEAGVVPIGKHFPGYGDLAGDSDHALVSTDWDAARVKQELAVFGQAHAVLGGVLLANVAYPAFDARAAGLSPALVELAHAHGWITVTDDLSIGLLADSIEGTTEEVFKLALLAGNDLLLTTAPPDWAKATDVIGVLTTFAQEDKVARARVDAACRRVLRLKDQLGLLDAF
jgi:beta-N-acetylhexosaminidase